MLFKEFKASDFNRYYDKRGQSDPEIFDAILTDFNKRESFKIEFNGDSNPDTCEIIKVVAKYDESGDFDRFKEVPVFFGSIENAKKIEYLKDFEIELNVNGDFGFLYLN